MKYIDKLLLDVINDAHSIGIPISNNIVRTIYIDKKRYDRVASCYKYALVDMYVIHISEDTLQANENEIKNIIAHEILHTCDASMDHGYLWKKYCKLMNNHYGYDIQIKYSWNKILKK